MKNMVKTVCIIFFISIAGFSIVACFNTTNSYASPSDSSSNSPGDTPSNPPSSTFTGGTYETPDFRLVFRIDGTGELDIPGASTFTYTVSGNTIHITMGATIADYTIVNSTTIRGPTGVLWYKTK